MALKWKKLPPLNLFHERLLQTGCPTREEKLPILQKVHHGESIPSNPSVLPSNRVFYSNSKLVKQIIRHEFLSQTPRLCNLSHPRGWPRSVLLLCGWVLYGVPSTLALKHLETFESFQSCVRLCVRAPCIA